MSGLCAGRTIGGGRVSGRRHRGVKGGRVAERVRVRESATEGTWNLAKLADFPVAEGWSMTSAMRAYAPR
jgi:hypothetical protein